MYVPSMASRGVLKPSPTFFQKRVPAFPGAFPFDDFLVLRKTFDCFKNDLSVCKRIGHSLRNIEKCTSDNSKRFALSATSEPEPCYTTSLNKDIKEKSEVSHTE
jgi:hypothetical protein